MQRYIVVRVVQGVVTLLVLSLAVFLSVHLTGDPTLYLLGPEGTQQDYEQLKRNMGLDKPLPVQYAVFLGNVVQGDFGNSHITGQMARKTLMERFPATLQLAGVAFLLTMAVGIPLGILSAVKRDTIIDQFGKFFAVLGIATPSFWVAIMLILLFGAILGWLPTFGRGGLDHFILPAFVLSWGGMAGIVRLVRSSMLEVLDSEYVKFARVKGLPEKMVIYKHALKNAVIPALTFGGLTLDTIYEDCHEWVLRLEYRASWFPEEERCEEWVHYPKESDPGNDSFTHTRRRDVEELGFGLLRWNSGRVLDLGTRGDFMTARSIDGASETGYSRVITNAHHFSK